MHTKTTVKIHLGVVLAALMAITGCGPKDGDGTKPRIASLDSKDWKSRVDKIDVLAEARSNRTLALIVRAMSDPHPRVREAAVKALARRDDKSVIPELAKVVKDPDEQVRMAAVAALQKFTGAQAVSVVLLRLGAGSDKERQAVVAGVSSQLKRSTPADRAASLKRLIIMVKAEQPSTQQDAARILQTVGATAARPILDALADAKPGSRGAWVQLLEGVLGKMGSAAVYPLVAALRFAHQSEARARAAVTPLVQIGAAAVPALIATLDWRKQYSHDAGDLARQALVRIGARAVPGITAKLLSNKHADRRLCGTLLLQAIRNAAAVAPLLKMLAAEGNRTLRLATIRALGLSGSPKAVNAILAALRKDGAGSRATPRRWAAYREALLALRIPDKTLVDLLKAPEPQVRLVAIQMAGRRKVAAAAAALPALLKDKRQAVVQAAAWAAGELQAKATLRRLRQLASHKNHAIRLHAVVAMGRFGGKKAAGTLVGAARFRKSSAVKAAALLALGRLRLKAGMKAAKKGRYKSSRIIRTAAVWTLARLKGKTTRLKNPTLAALLQDQKATCAKENPEGDAFVDLLDIYRYGDVRRLEFVIRAKACKNFQSALAQLAVVKGAEQFTTHWGTTKRKKRAQGMFEAGVRQGRFLRWHKSGKVETRGLFLGGRRHSRWQTYWENGKRRSRGRYFNGKRKGAWKRWYASGTVQETGSYKSGRPEGRWTSYHSNGQKALVLRYKAGRLNGPQVSHYPGGKKSGEAIFVKGQRQGPWRTFHPNGQKRSQGSYEAGLRHGSWRWFYVDGKKRESGTFERGRKVGAWTTWDLEGTIIQQCTYSASAPPKCGQ